ncbi:Chromodomain-helicase-DNA-binding protein 1-like [Chytriomyces hyalinus]|nr:Chromodomain-helicase-DNA-binding protein 1-like [Chytriomyces hyalinus]
MDLKQVLAEGVNLRAYQTEGVEWMTALFEGDPSSGCILADEMGLGKTLQTITLLLSALHANLVNLNSKFLIVVPLSLLRNWVDEFEKFASKDVDVRVVAYAGTKDERAVMREQIEDGKVDFNVLLTTYEGVCSDFEFVQTFEWSMLVVDEAHRLKNPNSLLHKTLKTLNPSPLKPRFKRIKSAAAASEAAATFKILLTGTPVQNNLSELEALLSFAVPDKFTTDGELQRVYGSGHDDAEKRKLMKALNELVKPYILRRDKETVLTLPPMKETVLYTPMTPVQKSLYKSILTKDMSPFETGRRAGLMNILMQLRKCGNHPYLFDGIEPEPFQAGDHLFEASGKLMVLDGLLKYFHSHGHRVLIFSQMTAMLDILQDYLSYRSYTHLRLDGSIRGQDRYDAVKKFTDTDADDEESAFVFLLSTRAGGVGLNLTAANIVIFMDSDFNPMMDMQAAARAHRIGQTKPVEVIRLLTQGSVEEVIYRRASAKKVLSQQVLDRAEPSASSNPDTTANSTAGSDLVSILRFGLSKLVADDADADASANAAAFSLVKGFTASMDSMNDASMDVDCVADETPINEDASIYLYEGVDFKKDQDALMKLKTQVLGTQAVSKAAILGARKVEMAKRAEEAREKREARLQDKWDKMGYASHVIPSETAAAYDDEVSSPEGDDDEDDSLESSARNEEIEWFSLKTGSVTDPAVGASETGIIVHIVDDSGRWPNRGVFGALNFLDPEISIYYIASFEAGNLKLGSAHLLPNSISTRSGGKARVCLIVAQKRGKDNPLGEIRLPDLESGLQSLGRKAKELKASVHLPRFGQDTPGFDWYQTERIIRKCLPSRCVKTILYYFRRARGDTKTASRATSHMQSLHHTSPHQPVTKSVNAVPHIPMKRAYTHGSSSKSFMKAPDQTVAPSALLKKSVSSVSNSSVEDMKVAKSADPPAVHGTPVLPNKIDASCSSDAKLDAVLQAGKDVIFMFCVKDAADQKRVSEKAASLGGVVIGHWDRKHVTRVVVQDENAKDDLMEGSKSRTAVSTVSEYIRM